MTDESTTTTDSDAEAFTNKHLNRELVTWAGYTIALQMLIVTLLFLVLLEPPMRFLSSVPLLLGVLMLLIPKAADGSPYARRFFEMSRGEQIDWDDAFPEVTE